MRPKLQILDDFLLQQIIDEAFNILNKTGVEILSDTALKFLDQYDVHVSRNHNRVFFNQNVIERSLDSVPPYFSLFDLNDQRVANFRGRNVHFTPGSSALNFLDSNLNKIRKPSSEDYVTYVKVIDQLEYLATQSTAFIPADVDARIADVYRLLLSLSLSSKPVITGTFSPHSFDIMYELQVIARGSEQKLQDKPLTIFTCCPTSPLKWNYDSAETLIKCARKNIPVEIVPMLLAGFSSPVTMTDTLIQHCAEALSGLVIHQLANPGAPALFGTASTVFDMKSGTTPLGSIESMMMACAVNEIGKKLKIPTQAYIALSDAKDFDIQAGFETGMGAVMAALSGINNVSGPGMLDFVNCFSIEKLIIDNDIAGTVLHLEKGITPKEDFPASEIFNELLKENHLLTSNHTTRFLRDEHFIPGGVINRQSMSQWEGCGAPDLKNRCESQIKQYLQDYENTDRPTNKIPLMQEEFQNYCRTHKIPLPLMLSNI